MWLRGCRYQTGACDKNMVDFRMLLRSLVAQDCLVSKHMGLQFLVSIHQLWHVGLEGFYLSIQKPKHDQCPY